MVEGEAQDKEPVWPEPERETRDRSQDREMTDIGWSRTFEMQKVSLDGYKNYLVNTGCNRMSGIFGCGARVRFWNILIVLRYLIF